MSVIGLANQTMTTPALIEVVRRFPELVPHDVSCYILEISERNIVRNNRLLAQLTEAVATLNRSRITPVLLKGTALLATASRDQMATRLISDLDICVPAAEFETSLECLLKIGYGVYFRASEGDAKCYADLERPEDDSMIDLHQGPPGNDFFYRSMGDRRQHCELRIFGKAEAHVPTATHHALMLIIHDQFQDFRLLGRRHRYAASLGHAAFGKYSRWHRLDRSSLLRAGKLAKNAMETQLVSLFSLLEVDVPVKMRNRLCLVAALASRPSNSLPTFAVCPTADGVARLPSLSRRSRTQPANQQRSGTQDVDFTSIR